METAVKLNEEEFQEQSLTLLEQAKTLAIKTPEDYQRVGEFVLVTTAMIKKIKEYFKPLKTAADRAHAAICDREKQELSIPVQADTMGRIMLRGYQEEQDRIRIEAQRKAELAAQEVARKEQERLLEKAAKADAQGKTDKAEALMEQAENVYVEPVVVAPTVEKTVQLNGGSVTIKKDLEIKVIDLQELCRAIGQGSVPTTVIAALEGKLKAWFKIQGTYSNGYAFGCQIRETLTPSVRG
jgi:hypothetical protein